MSIKSLISSAWAAIEHLFTGLESELKSVVLPAAIAVVNVAKTIVIDDATDVIGSLAGAAGSAIEDKIRAVLPTVVAKMQLAQTFLAMNPTPEELLVQVVKIGQGLTGNTRASYLLEFAAQLASALSEGKLTVAEGALLTQQLYAALNQPVSATETIQDEEA